MQHEPTRTTWCHPWDTPDFHKRLMWLASSALLEAPAVHAIGYYGLPFVVAPVANPAMLAANPLGQVVGAPPTGNDASRAALNDPGRHFPRRKDRTVGVLDGF